MVSVSLERHTVLFLSEHHSEGAHPNCLGSSCVGTGVDRQSSLLEMR